MAQDPAGAPSEAPTSQDDTPYHRLGGEVAVRALAERFYDAMDAHEPALARLHELDAEGRVSRRSRDRFALFLIGWLGGPQTYMAQHGHPRLRMRHARVPVDTAMRDAWLRCMDRALEGCHPVDGLTLAYLRQRFAEVADFLRNHPDVG
jgi:hemoglobin